MVWIGIFRSFKLIFLMLLNKLMKSRYSLDKMSYFIPIHWMLLSIGKSEVGLDKLSVSDRGVDG